MEVTYTKLSELDGREFTVERAYGFKLKKWDNASRRMLVEDAWNPALLKEGYRKIYALDTDKGKLDISEKQLSDMLVKTYKNGEAGIVGRTFAVKKVIGQNDFPNYYFNAQPQREVQKIDEVVEPTDEPIDLDSIPF